MSDAPPTSSIGSPARRPRSSLLATVVVAVGATAAAVAIGAPEPAETPPVGGTIAAAELDGWCREALGTPDADATFGGGGWRCIGFPAGLFLVEPLDAADACVATFGPGAWRTRASERGVACAT